MFQRGVPVSTIRFRGAWVCGCGTKSRPFSSHRLDVHEQADAGLWFLTSMAEPPFNFFDLGSRNMFQAAPYGLFFVRSYVTLNGSGSIFRKGTDRIDRSTVSHSPACSPRTDRGDGGHGVGGGGIGVEGREYSCVSFGLGLR